MSAPGCFGPWRQGTAQRAEDPRVIFDANGDAVAKAFVGREACVPMLAAAPALYAALQQLAEDCRAEGFGGTSIEAAARALAPMAAPAPIARSERPPAAPEDASAALQRCLEGILPDDDTPEHRGPTVDLLLASGGGFRGSLASMQDGCVDLHAAGMWYRIRLDQIVGVGWASGEGEEPVRMEGPR